MERKEQLTISHFLSINAKQEPNQTAIGYRNMTYTSLEFEEITDRTAFYFLEKGIKCGDHVGIWGANSINWVITYYALAKIGAVSVLINFKYKRQELIFAAEYADLAFLCYGRGHREREIMDVFYELKKGHGIHCIDIETDEIYGHGIWDQRRLKMEKDKVSEDSVLCMLFTSGTTSKPKGVMLTQYQMLRTAKTVCAQMGWTKEDKICLPLSLFHCFGLSTGLLSSLVLGCSIYLTESFRTAEVLGMVQREKCTVLNGVPSMFLTMIKNSEFSNYDTSSLCSGIIAGSRIRVSDYRAICQMFPTLDLLQSYGQTEASPSITFVDDGDSKKHKESSVGKAAPGVSIRIRCEQGQKQDETAGEIQIKGFNVMKFGYYKNPEESKKAFTNDGWLKTGDIGCLDDEGYLYITGRKKDIIIRCGENISPAEIEDVMLKFPEIVEAKVFGVPDARTQEEVAAVIQCEHNWDETKFYEYLKQEIADYKIPRYISRIESFPLLANGKVDMKRLKDDLCKSIRRTRNEFHTTT